MIDAYLPMPASELEAKINKFLKYLRAVYIQAKHDYVADRIEFYRNPITMFKITIRPRFLVEDGDEKKIRELDCQYFPTISDTPLDTRDQVFEAWHEHFQLALYSLAQAKAVDHRSVWVSFDDLYTMDQGMRDIIEEMVQNDPLTN